MTCKPLINKHFISWFRISGQKIKYSNTLERFQVIITYLFRKLIIYEFFYCKSVRAGKQINAHIQGIFSQGTGVGAGRGRDFDIFLIEFFKSHFPRTCIVKIHQKCHAFTVVNLFYFLYSICSLFCQKPILWSYYIPLSVVWRHQWRSQCPVNNRLD